MRNIALTKYKRTWCQIYFQSHSTLLSRMSRSRSRSRGRRRKKTTSRSSSKFRSNHKKKSRTDEEERRKDKKVSRDNLSDCSTASRRLLHGAEQSQVGLPFLIINYYQHTISILWKVLGRAVKWGLPLHSVCKEEVFLLLCKQNGEVSFIWLLHLKTLYKIEVVNNIFFWFFSLSIPKLLR